MVKAVIFDLDGVVIDSEPIAYGILREMAGSYDGVITLEEYTSQYLGRTIAMAMSTIKNTFDAPQSEEELFMRYMSIERERIKSGIPLKSYAKDILKALKEKNIKTIVASSSVRERAESILKYHNIDIFFDDLVFGYEVPRGKPFPDIFIKACEKLGVSADEAVVIEDSEAGIKAAYSANIPVICIPDMVYPRNEYKKMATVILNNLREAEEYILQR